MEAKEILLRLKETFNELINPAPAAPVQLMDAQLLDGTPIKVTDMAAGGIVTINDMPAPAGEYELVDGTKLKVGDNGAIVEIMPAAAPAAPAPDAPVQMSTDEKFTQFETSTNQKFSEYESKFAAYEQKFSEYELKMSKATTLIEGLMSLVTKISETPVGTPDPSVKQENKFIEEKTVIEKAQALFS